jgi:hypothetical protein
MFPLNVADALRPADVKGKKFIIIKYTYYTLVLFLYAHTPWRHHARQAQQA